MFSNKQDVSSLVEAGTHLMVRMSANKKVSHQFDALAIALLAAHNVKPLKGSWETV